MRTMPYNLASSASMTIRTAINETNTLTTEYDKASVALNTGKKINTSYDNSILFFKDMRLTERAEGLLSVVDGLSNVVSLLNTSGSAVDSITSFLKQAKAAAEAAIDGSTYTSQLTAKKFIFDEKDTLDKYPNLNAGDEIIVRTGDADQMKADVLMNEDTTFKELNIMEGEEFNIKIGDNDWMRLTVIDEDMKVGDFFGQIHEQCPTENFRYAFENGKLTISTNDCASLIVEGSAAEAMGFDLSNTTKIMVRNGWTVSDLMDSLSAIDGVKATINTEGHLQITSVRGDDLAIADFTGTGISSMGLSGLDDSGDNVTKAHADQFNELMKQINDIVKDSSYNGLNLLQGDTIRAIFNEEGTTYRTVRGVKLDTESLGIPTAKNDWTNKQDISAALDAVQNALYTVEEATTKFQRASQMIQSRTDFMESLADTAQTGAETLTGADLNEVSAELLAIDTQKQLVNQVISITLKTNSSVLSLFS